MIKFSITSPDDLLRKALQHKIDSKTKPPGSLGKLEKIALQIGLIQQTLKPSLVDPAIIVFAADHGIVQEGVSPYPQEVTRQMVMNFLHGGAAINVFCRQHDIDLHIVDAGVNADFNDDLTELHRQKISYGTANILQGSAMSLAQAQQSIESGADAAGKFPRQHCNIIGFGEMGIGNTSSAALIMSACTALPIEACTGRGTGLDDTALNHKIAILKQAQLKNGIPETPLEILATYGGFEIGQIVGAMLRSAEKKRIILVDGFIASAAYLIAEQLEPRIRDYCIFCHQSHERGHQKLLSFLNVTPLLHLDMRLGEGTGVAVAYPIIRSAVEFLNTMASFESAGVSNKLT